MGALFNDLHAVALVLAEHITDGVGLANVQPGAPRNVTATTDAGARILLLYSTPQPGHRNDPPEPEPGGARRFPPLSLSCFFLITTSGADNDDPIAAYNALGQIMTLYHDEPVLRLPLSDNPGAPPGAFSELGVGELSVTQVPMVLDQIDKIWTSLDVQLQPWALFEVAPVQLVSQRPDEAPRRSRARAGSGSTCARARARWSCASRPRLCAPADGCGSTRSSRASRRPSPSTGSRCSPAIRRSRRTGRGAAAADPRRRRPRAARPRRTPAHGPRARARLAVRRPAHRAHPRNPLSTPPRRWCTTPRPTSS